MNKEHLACGVKVPLMLIHTLPHNKEIEFGGILFNGKKKVWWYSTLLTYTLFLFPIYKYSYFFSFLLLYKVFLRYVYGTSYLLPTFLKESCIC